MQYPTKLADRGVALLEGPFLQIREIDKYCALRESVRVYQLYPSIAHL